MPLRYVAVTLITCVFYASLAHGSAPFHGAKAAGMNTAFTGLADDPAAILYNPAGIAQLDGTQLYGGGTALTLGSTYRNPSGQSVETQFKVFFVPHMFLTHRLHLNSMTVGLGIFAPFGIGGRKWPAGGPTRYSSIESSIGTVAVNPTLAIKLLPSLSIGVGFDYIMARNVADSAVDQSTSGAADARIYIKTKGDGWGYNLGLLYRADNTWSIGAAYRSSITVDQNGSFDMTNIAPAIQPLFGGSTFESPASGKLNFPEQVDLGIAYRPMQCWVLDVDIEWTGWSSFQRAELDLANKVPAAGLTDISVPLNWHDVWAYKIGGDFQVSDHLSLRAGYAFLNTPVPEATLSPANPDGNQHNFSVGIGWREGKWTIDGYYNLGIFVKRNVSNSILSGSYESHAHYLGVSVGWHI